MAIQELWRPTGYTKCGHPVDDREFMENCFGESGNMLRSSRASKKLSSKPVSRGECLERKTTSSPAR
jgi:hypothetical protein